MLRMRTRTVALIYALLCVASVAQAQAPAAVPDAAASTPEWSARSSAAIYFLPDESNYLQPTIAADRGWLHVEGRLNYEDLHSISGFVGWNLAFGETVALELTPMFGGVTGDTDGIIPALEMDLTWSRLEFYLEGEYVFDLDHKRDRFLYSWSETSLWITEWMRAGLVTQRTRAYRTPRDIQRGLIVGVNASRIEAAVYFFNPGSDDQFIVTSIGLTF